jgi:hypothetical protein
LEGIENVGLFQENIALFHEELRTTTTNTIQQLPMGFVVYKVALGQVFSEYFFGFPCQSSFHQFLHNHHHLSSVAGTLGQ